MYGSFQACGHEFDDLRSLLGSNAAIPIDDVLDIRPTCEALEDDGYGQAGVLEHPGAMNLLRVGFDPRALRPVRRWQFLHLAPVSYTHLRAHETVLDLVCRLL